MATEIEAYYANLAQRDNIPETHKKKLAELCHNGFKPTVIYDIGACFGQWRREAKVVWPSSNFVLFEANARAKFLYQDPHYIGVLSDCDGKVVDFYINYGSPGGASYFREIGDPSSNILYTENNIEKRVSITLDTIVAHMNFPLPDLIKMDIQGSELDVCKGATKCLKHCKYLILELPHEGVHYNQNAPSAEEVIDYLNGIGFKYLGMFCNNGDFDGDHLFMNTTT
jgi:FkbM family methyltransferase